MFDCTMKNILKRKHVYILSLLFTIVFSSCARRVHTNPYLTMKVKPSEQLKRETERNMAIARKEYKEQLVKNKENLNKSNKKFLKKKHHWKKGNELKREKVKARL